LLARFYRGLRTATAAAELHYWTVHRTLAGQVGAPELENALAGIVTAIYHLPRQRAMPSAIARARACDLVDAITGGRKSPTAEHWRAVVAALQDAYGLLCKALHNEVTTAI
jgi:hypothetical protein